MHSWTCAIITSKLLGGKIWKQGNSHAQDSIFDMKFKPMHVWVVQIFQNIFCLKQLTLSGTVLILLSASLPT